MSDTYRGSGTALLIAAAAVLLLASLSATGTQSAASSARGADHGVAISNFAFSPGSVTIAPGDTVTWTNNDGVTHTVTADDGTWESAGLVNGQTYTRQFNATGDYAYHCSPHPSMTGTVHVSDGSSPPPTPEPNGPGLSSSVIIAIAGVIVVAAICAAVLLRRARTK